MANDNASLGTASLWTSIIGVVLPVSLAILVAVFRPPLTSDVTALCGVLLLILELVALGCGIAARRTATGKAGLVISSIMVLIILVLVSITVMPKGSPRETAEPDRQEADHPNPPEMRKLEKAPPAKAPPVPGDK